MLLLFLNISINCFAGLQLYWSTNFTYSVTPTLQLSDQTTGWSGGASEDDRAERGYSGSKTKVAHHWLADQTTGRSVGADEDEPAERG